MVTPSGDARVSKKQKKAQESTLAEIASSTQVAPICSGHSGLLFPSRSKPAPISLHFQAPRVRSIGPAGDSRRQLLPPPPPSGSGALRRQLLAAHQFPEEAQGIEKTLPMVPSQRTIDSSRAGLLATSQRQRKPYVQDVQSTWEHARQRKREGHAWSIRVGVFGENRTIVEPFTSFLCVVENKGPINEESVFKLVGCLLDVRENVRATFRQAFVEFQDNLYNLKGASEDDSSFKASDESEDSDNSNSNDGRDVEEITPSFGRELVEHEDAESLPSGPGAPTSTPGNSNFNDVRERIEKLNMVDERPLILLVDTIDHPPLDPITQKRPLEVRSIIPAHVSNLKLQMKDKPTTNVLPLHVLLDPASCPNKASFVKSRIESYKYFVLGGTHFLVARKELCAEYPFVESYKIILAWVYAGLSDEDAKTLALDHNVDLEMRLSMSFLPKVHYFHNEWVDHLRQGKKADEAFKVRLCEQVGLATKKSKKGERGAKQNIRGRARADRRRLEDAENIVNNPDISTFVSDDITTLHVQYSVFEGKVENMESFVPRRHYTLGIADAPYGFKAPHSINDDVKYGLSAYKKVIEAFKKVTSAESWVLVIFHAHDQIFAAKKAFVDNSMVHQLCIW
ncbi:hypothetical protein L7F22_053211 [Adiantum nelumboides]|nr:hypothetical protein [Adiantum nelumboides]